MGRTSAERMRKYRENMKAKDVNELKAKQRQWANKCRIAKRNNKKKDQKEKLKMYMKNYRLKKKLEKQGSENISSKRWEWQNLFGNAQAFGKAVKKAKAALPHEDAKKVIVLQKLLSDLKIDQNISQRSEIHNDSITGEESQLQIIVSNFYESDEVSKHSPNKKDVLLNGK